MIRRENKNFSRLAMYLIKTLEIERKNTYYNEGLSFVQNLCEESWYDQFRRQHEAYFFLYTT